MLEAGNYIKTLQDGMYKPVVITDRVIDVRPQHDSSSSTSSVPLCCIDDSGKFKYVGNQEPTASSLLGEPRTYCQ